MSGPAQRIFAFAALGAALLLSLLGWATATGVGAGTEGAPFEAALALAMDSDYAPVAYLFLAKWFNILMLLWHIFIAVNGQMLDKLSCHLVTLLST